MTTTDLRQMLMMVLARGEKAAREQGQPHAHAWVHHAVDEHPEGWVIWVAKDAQTGATVDEFEGDYPSATAFFNQKYPGTALPWSPA